MKRALSLVLVLAACGTPQERCISGASRDVRIVDRLIAETEGNLARGYALVEVRVYEPEFRPCYYRSYIGADGKRYGGGTQFCWDERETIVQKPKAIDLGAEQQKLRGLRAKRSSLARQTAPAIAQCQAQYPE